MSCCFNKIQIEGKINVVDSNRVVMHLNTVFKEGAKPKEKQFCLH